MCTKLHAKTCYKDEDECDDTDLETTCDENRENLGVVWASEHIVY